MPSLRAALDIAIDAGALTAAQADTVHAALVLAMPGERLIIPNGTKDPARKERIRELAKRLPVAVVAERVGVHRSYVYRLTRR